MIKILLLIVTSVTAITLLLFTPPNTPIIIALFIFVVSLFITTIASFFISIKSSFFVFLFSSSFFALSYYAGFNVTNTLLLLLFIIGLDRLFSK